jgi:hypothetical protein
VFEILTVTLLYILKILFYYKNRIYTTMNSDVHSYNTMHRHNLYVQHCYSNRSNSTVINMGIKLFNNLPLELKSISDFNVIAVLSMRTRV